MGAQLRAVREPASASPKTRSDRLQAEGETLARQARVATGAAEIAQTVFSDQDDDVRSFLTTWAALLGIADRDVDLLREMLGKLVQAYGQ